MLPSEPKPDRQQGCNSFYHSWLSCRFLNQTFGCYEVTGSRAHEGNVCSVQSLASRLRFSNRLSLSPIYTSVTIFPNMSQHAKRCDLGEGRSHAGLYIWGKTLAIGCSYSVPPSRARFSMGRIPCCTIAMFLLCDPVWTISQLERGVRSSPDQSISSVCPV